MGSNPTASSRLSIMKTVDHFYSYRTYSGCMEGYPSLASAYDSVRSQAKRLWGPRPVYILEPIIKLIPKEHGFGPYEVLPDWVHMVWVSSFASIKGDSDGSELVIVWFSSEPIVNVSDIVDKVDWKAHAKDFEY